MNALAKKTDENLYSKPGPHMWRLLFQERPYKPLPFTWHAWHLLVAISPAVVVWYWLDGVREKLRASKEERERIEQALKNVMEQEQRSKQQDIETLSEELVRLRKEVDTLKQDVVKQHT